MRSEKLLNNSILVNVSFFLLLYSVDHHCIKLQYNCTHRQDVKLVEGFIDLRIKNSKIRSFAQPNRSGKWRETFHLLSGELNIHHAMSCDGQWPLFVFTSLFSNEQQFNAISDHTSNLRSIKDVPTFKLGDFIETLPNDQSIDTSDYSSQPDNQQKSSFFSTSSSSNTSINGTNASGIVSVCSTLPSASSSPKSGPIHLNYSQQRYKPYYNRSFSNTSSSSYGQQTQVLMHPPGFNITGDSGISSLSIETDPSSNSSSLNSSAGSGANVDTTVTLQISNIDASIDDRALKNYLISKLKPITPILSFVFEGLTVAKIRIPSQHHAKQVVAYLHRKKIGHKRIIVSYTRDSSTMEPSTLRCQVAGLLKVLGLACKKGWCENAIFSNLKMSKLFTYGS